MAPIYYVGPRGERKIRIPDGFYCADHKVLARGRKKPVFSA